MASVVQVQTLLRSPNGAFVLIDACRERPSDVQYIEGAIELAVDGVPILTVTEWDYVDQLWSYISDMIRSLSDAGEATTYFPDQPIMLEFVRSSPGRLLVSCKIGKEVRRVNVEESQFLKALRA